MTEPHGDHDYGLLPRTCSGHWHPLAAGLVSLVRAAYRSGQHGAGWLFCNRRLHGRRIDLDVGMAAGLGARCIAVEAVGVLHDELATPHQAKARATLVTKLRLDLIKIFGHVVEGKLFILLVQSLY